MDWPALVEALKPYGFRASVVFGFEAIRYPDSVRVAWKPGGKVVEVYGSCGAMLMDRPPLFSGSPEEVVGWLSEREGVTT